MSESSERARFEVNHCTAAQNQVLAEAGNTMLYGLDFPQCATMSEKKQLLRHILRDRLRALPPSTHRSEFRSRLLAEDAGRACQDADEPPFDMCSIPEASTYLNRADVRSALHVSSKAAAVWMGCSQTLNYSVTDPNVAQEGYYQQVIEMSKESGANLRLLVMSGDDDAVCGTLGTQSWMDSRFGGSIIEPWQPWRYDSEEYGQQIGGFVVQFDGISLATVHGAGHMCATYQPEKTFALVQRFLSGSLTTVA